MISAIARTWMVLLAPSARLTQVISAFGVADNAIFVNNEHEEEDDVTEEVEQEEE